MSIKVIIEGANRIGKSSIAAILAKSLAEHGIAVNIHNKEELPGAIEETLDARLAAVCQRGTEVQVFQRSVPRIM